MTTIAILAAGLMRMGLYSGQAILYPYDPVYCDGNGDAGKGCYGVMMYLPDSAPLPDGEKHCRYADGSISPPKNWFQWEPRIMQMPDKKYLGDRVCFLDDRGEARDINDLPRD